MSRPSYLLEPDVPALEGEPPAGGGVSEEPLDGAGVVPAGEEAGVSVDAGGALLSAGGALVSAGGAGAGDVVGAGSSFLQAAIANAMSISVTAFFIMWSPL